MVEHITGNKEYDKLKAMSVGLVGGNSDGKQLFLAIEVFDGEHTNRFEVEFPVGTTSEKVADYMIEIIEDNPKLPPEIINMIQKRIFWDETEKGWYSKADGEKPVRLVSQDHRAEKYEKANQKKDAQSAKDAHKSAHHDTYKK